MARPRDAVLVEFARAQRRARVMRAALFERAGTGGDDARELRVCLGATQREIADLRAELAALDDPAVPVDA